MTNPSQPDGRSRDLWTAATFLIKARELKRRLEVWHIPNPYEPVECFSYLDTQAVIRRTFREIVCHGEHDFEPPALSRQAIDPGNESDPEVVGTVFQNPRSELDTTYTRWLLRDFFEHLPDAGSGTHAEVLRLEFDQLLDIVAYSRRAATNTAESQMLAERNTKSHLPHSLIGGRMINSEVLNNLVDAATDLVSEHAALSSAKMELESTSESLPKKELAGWMGDTELATTLGVHASQTAAFRAKLRRMREKKKLSMDDWREAENPKRNEPQFLYRANTPAIAAMAKRYLLPKTD